MNVKKISVKTKQWKIPLWLAFQPHPKERIIDKILHFVEILPNLNRLWERVGSSGKSQGKDLKDRSSCMPEGSKSQAKGATRDLSWLGEEPKAVGMGCIPEAMGPIPRHLMDCENRENSGPLTNTSSTQVISPSLPTTMPSATVKWIDIYINLSNCSWERKKRRLRKRKKGASSMYTISQSKKKTD